MVFSLALWGIHLSFCLKLFLYLHLAGPPKLHLVIMRNLSKIRILILGFLKHENNRSHNDFDAVITCSCAGDTCLNGGFPGGQFGMKHAFDKFTVLDQEKTTVKTIFQ